MCEGACGSLVVGERAGEQEPDARSTSVEIVSERRLHLSPAAGDEHDAASSSSATSITRSSRDFTLRILEREPRRRRPAHSTSTL